MVKNFVRIDGWPVAPAVARDYVRMKADHDRATVGRLAINSGYRTNSEQEAIFTARYRRGAYSPYGDYRLYQGVSWGRVSGLGPVASPDVGSNHTRGFALDLNVTNGSASQRWLLENAWRYGFNWTEGRSVAEPWHWCWKVAIFPTGAEPDPWEGRGAPDPVYPTDPGMSLDSAAGGGGGEDVMNKEQEAKLDEVLAFARWYQKRDGGSTDPKYGLPTYAETSKQVESISKRIAVRENGASIGSTFDGVVEILHAQTALLEAIRQTLGRSKGRVDDGDTIGVSLDRVSKQQTRLIELYEAPRREDASGE